MDDAQNAYTGWTYKIIEAVQGVAQNRVKYFSPVLGQNEVDFDMISTGAVGTPTLGVIPPVTSVNGKTGVVVIDTPVTLSYDTDGFAILTFHEPI
ncbi:hypothetical protein [Microbacterium sp. SORGH_AS_0428]|uniref:hypothetical protein n=1 Tax=Microbacterium sp. SORGH_AS_0428 TaxID=3041788 RepID=UPI00286D44CC|nr:hypothetical protein [Microbacterium sp. SORGH_AS_0428]